MIKDRNIVVVGLQPWDIEIGSNCKNIAIELAKNNRVLYVNAPVDRNTLIKGKGKADKKLLRRLEVLQSGQSLYEVGQNMWNLYPKKIIHSINWLPFTFLFRALNYYNNVRFASDIREAIEELGFDDFILFNDSDMFRSYHLKELLKPSLSIYYSRDNLMAFRYWKKHGRFLEPEIIAKSDIVVANSLYLCEIAKKHNPQSFYVGQGCDLSVFDPVKERKLPDDMSQIKGPVIGYIGAIISSRLDVQLLLELCKKRPDWSLVLVGNADEVFVNSGLLEMDNVHYLGLKPGEMLPDYLAHFDVALNPQLVNELTIGNYPRKIDEYLAMGKPVVATRTLTMEIFNDVVYLGESVEDYINLISLALSENNIDKVKKRIAFANEHTWENSVQAISVAIEQNLN